VVISHRHKYLFVQLPQTACTTVQNELIELYDGEKILFKHALYSDFLKQASAAEKEYFVFSSLRNPLDIVVSKYFKYKTDHVGAYSSPRKKQFGFLHKHLLRVWDRNRYQFIRDDNADFGAFFDRFYRLPYSSWAILDHHRFDYLIRYESLQEDFATMLDKVGIEPKRPLPARNVTGEKKKDFWSYYDTPELRRKAMTLFGRYMHEFEYAFPEDWTEGPREGGSAFQYNAINSMRRLYWRVLR
jgi:hypothetical protein